MGFRGQVVLVSALFAAVHGALAATIGLVDDEAYYTLWASVPGLGYYDHPPMIAWQIAAGTFLFGDTPFGVRVAAVAGFFAVSLMTGRIARLCGAQAPTVVTAVWVLNATLGILVLGFAATPDAPSLLFWTATLWAALEAEQKSDARWWLAAGAFAGLGVLAKFTNLFLGLGLALWLLATPGGRAHLRRWPVWGAGGIALAVMAPLVAWNAANGWVGLERQFSRIGDGGEGALGLPVLLVSTILLLTPLTAWFMAEGARLRFAGRGVLLLTSAPLALFMLQHSLGSSVPGNWLLPLYPVAAVLAALALERHAWGWTAGTAATGLLLGSVLLWAAIRPGAPVFPGNTPPNQFKGWPETGEQIVAAMQATGATWIAAERYGLAGQLFVALGESYPVHGLDNPRRYAFRGPRPADLCHAPGLLVTRAGGADNAPGMVVPAGPAIVIDRRSANAVVERYRLTPFAGLKDPACGN